MNRSEGSPALRIGELSRRLGVSDHVLRAWESRYGLPQPARSAGGLRLYGLGAATRSDHVIPFRHDRFGLAWRAGTAVLRQSRSVGRAGRAQPGPGSRTTIG